MVYLQPSTRRTRERAYLRASVEEPMPSGERMLLLRAEWIWLKLGLSVRSFCQQSSISWWRCGGQFSGAGSLKPSSMALITCPISTDGKEGFY